MAMERWAYINDDGAIVLHEENDGWTFLRRRAEAVERNITLNELKRGYPGRYKEALKLLAERNGRDA